jgi:hypothetical protein
MLNERPPDDGHRLNILSTTFTHIGIAVYRDSSRTVWLTRDFSNEPESGLVAPRRAVAADDLPGRAAHLAGPVRVGGQRPAELVQHHVMVPPVSSNP